MVVAIVVVVLLGGVAFAVYYLGRMLLVGAGSGGEIEVPNVLNLSQAEGEAEIKKRQLIPVIEYGNSDTAVKDVIYEQNPHAPRSMRPGNKVTIWVSMGKARYVIPQLVGKNVDDAEKELIADGLVIGEIKKVYDPTLPPGQVVGQDPASGREFTATQPVAVKLTVADKAQPPNGQMANLIGQSLAEAETLLARANLLLSKVTYVANDTAEAGTVTKQSITANAALKYGQKVELEVALPTAQVQQSNKSLAVNIVIPDGAAQQELRVEVQDELGKNPSLDEQKAPHDTVNKIIAVQGAAKILIFLRDMKTPWRTDIIPYTAPPPKEQKPAGDQAPPLGGNAQPPDNNEPPPGATL